MKKYTFPTTVICILLASVLLLAGCMHAVVDDMGTSKEYTAEIVSQTQLDVIIDGETPTAQSEMQKKFGVYLHETEDGGVRIFSGEQYDELKAVRDRGERIPLTYDEVLYLISDSINLYFKYDKITLTNAIKDSVYPDRTYSTEDTDDLCITSYHGDYSEYSLDREGLQQAYRKHGELEREIGHLIFYRLSMHDAGFVLLTHYINSDGNRYSLQFRSGMQDPVFYALSTDGSTVSGNENQRKLERELGKLFFSFLSDDTALQETLSAPLLLIPTVGWFDTIQIASPESAEITTVFPTTEVNARKPEKILELSASMLIDGNRYTLRVNRETGRFSLRISADSTQTVLGSFAEEKDYLTLYPEEMGDCSYVFSRNSTTSDVFTYSDPLSEPCDGLQFPYDIAFCKDYKDYLTKKALSGDSNAWYTVSGESFCMHQSILTHAELAFEDGSHTVVSIDHMPIEEYIKQNKKNLFKSTLYLGNYKDKVQVRLENGRVTGVTVYKKDGTEWVGTQTTLNGLSDLPEGEYCVAVHSEVEKGSAPCTATCRYIDVFVLAVKQA